MKSYLIIFLKGLLMGACDIIPGVSGGTIAFITGIYERLISSLTLLKPKLLKDLKQEGFSFVWKKIDGNFLSSLGAGILTGIFAFAKIMTNLLESHPPVVWSLFFSLVLASSIIMLLKIRSWNLSKLSTLLVGLALGYGITILSPSTGNDSSFHIFSSGFIAICAMILPGISGSFILLLLGQYLFILKALITLNISVLLIFSTGCFLGLLIFSHLLKWLFSKYHDTVFCLLIGFMFGSLNKLWPWKKTLSFLTDRHGKKIPAIEENILPKTYETLLSLDPMLTASIITMLSAFTLIFLFKKKL